MTDYKPIDCGRYSRYELAIMHHRRLRLIWRDDRGTVHLGVHTPTDLRTRSGEEFMVVKGQDGAEREIRLDRILDCSPA